MTNTTQDPLRTQGPLFGVALLVSLVAASEDYASVNTVVMEANGVAGYNTYQLEVQLTSAQTSLYAIFGDADHHMLLPAAYQVDAPFGANIGGTNPAFWSIQADAQVLSSACFPSLVPARLHAVHAGRP